MSFSSKINLLELAIIFARRKKTLISIMFLTTLLGVAASLVWPKSFKSELSFIVTESNAINFSGGGLIGGLANLSMSGGNVTSDQVLVIIRSNEILNDVIEEFDLAEIFGTDIPEALRRNLDSRIVIDEKREGGLGFNNIISISLSYSDENPQRAYDIVNYYFDSIDEKAKTLNRKNIEGAYLLLENRLEKNELELEIAEDSLVAFQKKYGILEVEEQAKAQIQTVGLLKTEIVKLEIQLGYLIGITGEDNVKVKELIFQKKEYEKKYDEMIRGVSESSQEFDPFYSISEMPELFIEYLRLYRGVIIQEEIYKALFPQFEQQKLRYQEVNSGLTIIDSALIPTYKDSPKRAYIVIAAFLFGFFLALMIIAFQEYKQSIKTNNKEEYSRFQEFSRSLKSWK